jgi:hypothetical protein
MTLNIFTTVMSTTKQYNNNNQYINFRVLNSECGLKKKKNYTEFWVCRDQNYTNITQYTALTYFKKTCCKRKTWYGLTKAKY